MAFDPSGYGMHLPPPPPPPPHPLYYSAGPYLADPTIPNAYPSSHSSCFIPKPPPPMPPFYSPPRNLDPAQPNARSPPGAAARDLYLVLPKDWCLDRNQFHGNCEVLVHPPAGCESHVPSYWCPAFYSLRFTKLAQWHEWSYGGVDPGSAEDLSADAERAWTYKWSPDGGHFDKCPLITVNHYQWFPTGQEFHGQCQVVAPPPDGFTRGPLSCPVILTLKYQPLAGWTQYPNQQVYTSPDDGSKEEDHTSSDGSEFSVNENSHGDDGSELSVKENSHGSGALPDMNLPPPADEAVQLQQMSHFIEEPWLYFMAEDWFGDKSNPVYRQTIDLLEDGPAQEPALDPNGWFSESRLIAEVEKLSDQLLLLRSSNEASELGKQDEDAVNRALQNLSECIGYNLETDTSESETSESTLEELEETGSTFSSNPHQKACRISDPKSEAAEVPAPDSAGLYEVNISQIGSDLVSKMLDEEHISSSWENVARDFSSGD